MGAILAAPEPPVVKPLTAPEWMILLKVREIIFSDSRENERYNSILKLQGNRAPSIGLSLLSARLCLKGPLGVSLVEGNEKLKLNQLGGMRSWCRRAV